MKMRIISWVVLGFLGILGIGVGLYARKVSSEARVVVEWSTASEMNTVGFNVLRAGASTDPGIRVNADLIPASDDPQIGGDYRYIDTEVIPGKVYYYYLEDVGSDGTTMKHGPVEVKAESGGRIEWVLTIALFVVILFGIGTLIWPRKKNL